jgi:hypothetical protein
MPKGDLDQHVADTRRAVALHIADRARKGDPPATAHFAPGSATGADSYVQQYFTDPATEPASAAAPHPADAYMRKYFEDEPAPAAPPAAALLRRDPLGFADVNPRTLTQLMADNPEGTGMVGAALLGMAAPEAAVAGLGYLGTRALPALKPLLRGTVIGAGFEGAEYLHHLFSGAPEKH